MEPANRQLRCFLCGSTEGNVTAGLQKLNLGKAVGRDGISAELLRGGGFIVVDWLLELMEEVLRTGGMQNQYCCTVKETE